MVTDIATQTIQMFNNVKTKSTIMMMNKLDQLNSSVIKEKQATKYYHLLNINQKIGMDRYYGIVSPKKLARENGRLQQQLNELSEADQTILDLLQDRF